MTARRIIGIAAVLALSGTLRARAQESPGHDISQVEVPPLGETIAPLMTEDERKKVEIPELAGTSLAVGSQLVDGRLPQPLADYVIKTKFAMQRISIFDSGLVVVHVKGDTGTVLKRLLLPQDALETFRTELSPMKLAEVAVDQLKLKPTSDIAVIRCYDSLGSHVDRKFDPTAALPLAIEHQRQLMQDLLNAIAQDREVTSSLTNYVPRIGDRLVGEDQKTYVVTAVYPDEQTVELTRADQPLRMYVASKDLNKFMVGARRPAAR